MCSQVSLSLFFSSRNDTMPVNPYRTFPVWQQAVSQSFTFCTQDSRREQHSPEFNPEKCSPQVKKQHLRTGLGIQRVLNIFISPGFLKHILKTDHAVIYL